MTIMRVLYLFTGTRAHMIEGMKRGDDPGDGTWGMMRLDHFGITADFLELEQYVPDAWAKWFRQRIFGVYGVHIPFFFHFFKYDIIFTAGAFYSQFLFTLARAFFRFKRPKWVMHDFSITGLLGDEKTLREKMFRFIVTHCSGVVTLSAEEAERLKKRFPHLATHIAYIPFGVDTTFFKPLEIEESGGVLSAGIDPDRDWKTLFKACEGLKVEVVAATRPRGKTVTPPSFVRRNFFSMKELLNEYGTAKVVVVPLDTSTGINDAMGSTALFEAMAMGKAIVATDTHTMRSHITHDENGLLVPEKNIEDMRAAINGLLHDDAKRKRLGRAARAYAVAHLDAEKLAGELAAYFRKLTQLE